MPRRTRKLIGAFVLIVLVIVWSLAAMMIAQVWVREIAGFAELTYYVIAGLGWVVPAMLVVRWMERPDAEDRA